MGAALKKLWAALAMLFTALEHGASAVNNIAIVGDEMSAAFVDQARIDRAKAASIMNRELQAELDGKNIPSLAAPV